MDWCSKLAPISRKPTSVKGSTVQTLGMFLSNLTIHHNRSLRSLKSKSQAIQHLSGPATELVDCWWTPAHWLPWIAPRPLLRRHRPRQPRRLGPRPSRRPRPRPNSHLPWVAGVPHGMVWSPADRKDGFTIFMRSFFSIFLRVAIDHAIHGWFGILGNTHMHVKMHIGRHPYVCIHTHTGQDKERTHRPRPRHIHIVITWY